MKPRIICVTVRPAAIEGGRIGFVKRRAKLETFHKIGIGQSPPAHGSNIGQARFDIVGNCFERPVDAIHQQGIWP